MNQQICIKCGLENPPEMKFCSNCGQLLASENAAVKHDLPPAVTANVPPFETPSPPQFTPDQPLNHSMPPKKSRKGLYFLLGGAGTFAVLAIVLVGGFILLMSMG